MKERHNSEGNNMAPHQQRVVTEKQEIEMETMSQFANEKDLLKAKVKRLEDILLRAGQWKKPRAFAAVITGRAITSLTNTRARNGTIS